MLQRDDSSSVKKNLTSVFKPSVCLVAVRILEADKAAAGAGRRPLLWANVSDCLGKAVRGGGRKDGEGAAVRRGQVGETNKRLEDSG